MQKEKFTLDNIKRDLYYEIKTGYKQIFIFSLFFAVLFLLFIPIFKLRIFFFSVSFILAFILEIYLLYMIIKKIIYLKRLKVNLTGEYCVEKDKLVNVIIEERTARHRIINIYHLHFLHYGEYIVPDENYKWSSEFSTSDRGIYNYSNIGDEFYLVLSKPYRRKILYAYNSKMFELVN